LFLNCGSASLNITSPELFRAWDIPVIRAVAAVARRHGRIFHYHLHGLGRKLLDDLVEAGVTMICPLETPPKGDFVLGEVKERFGDRLALKGGVDPFLLRDANPREIETIVRSCLQAAAPGGGYTLASGDGVLKETPFDSIRRLVELTEKLGSYR
jgi:uroporphyrinogen-III decarboxylase